MAFARHGHRAESRVFMASSSATENDEHGHMESREETLEEFIRAREAFFRARRPRRVAARGMARLRGIPQSRKKRLRYYADRHRMMMLLWKLEEGDVAALIRKVQYMSAADLPEMLDADRVLYYRDESDTVHLFYGGRKEPDGPGHGHVELINEGVTGHRVTYRRNPRSP